MVDAILFDVDGTLVDTETVVIATLQQLLRKYFELELPSDELKFVLGIPGEAALRHFTQDPALLQKMDQEWSQLEGAHPEEYRLFPKVEKLLKTLKNKGMALGVVTSKTSAEYQREVTQFNLDSLFNVIVTASDTSAHKPDPAPLLKAAEKLTITPERILYVGDTIYDLQAAHRAEMTFGLAGWGTQERGAFEEAEFIFERPHEIVELLS